MKKPYFEDTDVIQKVFNESEGNPSGKYSTQFNNLVREIKEEFLHSNMDDDQKDKVLEKLQDLLDAITAGDI